MGETVMEEVRSPVLQLYVSAPVTFRTAICPSQMVVFPETVSVGLGKTETVTDPVDEQFEVTSVPVTTYTLVVLGDTDIEALVTKLLQLYVPAPPAVKVLVCPSQTVVLPEMEI